MRDIIHDLERLRTRGRLLLIAQRVASVTTVAALVIAVCIALDYLLRLPAGFRFGLLVLGLVALGWAIVRVIGPAIGFAPTMTQLALRVESTIPGVRNRLASSVEFAMSGLDRSNPLAARSVSDTQTRLAGESVFRIIAPQRTIREVAGLVTVLVLGIGFMVVQPAAAQTGLARLFLPFTATAWPARTGVESLMFEVVGDRRVHPRGQTLALRARVTRGDLDQRVEAHYRLINGDVPEPWRHLLLTPQHDGVQERLVDANADRVELYFTTDDSLTTTESITLVPPPAVVRATLRVSPPGYASGRVPMTELEMGTGLDARAVTEAPVLAGSNVDLALRFNKPLAAPVDDAAARRTLGWDGGDLPLISTSPDRPEEWRLRWTIDRTRSLVLALEDEHGLGNTDTIAYRIDVVEDRSPSVTITLPETDEIVLPTARIPLAASARDDVALLGLGLEARRHLNGEPAPRETIAWDERMTLDDAAAAITATLDLKPLDLAEGDVIVIEAVAQDAYEVGGRTHDEVRSAARRLRVLSELEFATRLRRELAAVRQHAIRVEGLQGELQDDIIDSGVQPGVARAQAQIAERIATQRAALDAVAQRMDENRLDDEQLDRLLQQASDLLDFAGRGAAEAVEAMLDREAAAGDQSPAASGAERNAPANANPGAEAGERPAGADRAPGAETGAEAGERPAGAEREPGAEPGAEAGVEAGERPADEDFVTPEMREARPEDQEIVDAQQRVRDELTDLIRLLDRDEDTWVITRQIEALLDQQRQLMSETGELGRETLGKSRAEMTEGELSELERIAQRQRDLADKTRPLNEDLRDRADAMEEIDPGAAARMRTAATTGEQERVDRQMQDAAGEIDENQMRNAQGSQQAAIAALERQLQELKEDRRARTAELMRQLESLEESIKRLVQVQETELSALARAIHDDDFTGRDRAVIRLSQNTQSVAAEARAAGQDAARIARALDRAADAQGAGVVALRAKPIASADAEEAENRSLERLREALEFAAQLQEDLQQQETEQRKQELIAAYRALAEQEIGIRESTVGLGVGEALDRRQLMEARRLGNAQEDIRQALATIRDENDEINESPVFNRVHDFLETWSADVEGWLQEGRVDRRVSDQQQRIADGIGRMITALDDANAPPDEFAQEQQREGDQQQQQGQSGPQPLIPPIAELKLLRGMQEQIYNQTRDIDQREDIEAAQRRERLRDLGGQQRELMDLGRLMIEALREQGVLPQ
ncbi:MAG: hypothetical protein KDA25_07350 [Phycisphaerales bacterium]|nr:hypothetical protein [Phycisphaerales bacterium]